MPKSSLPIAVMLVGLSLVGCAVTPKPAEKPVPTTPATATTAVIPSGATPRQLDVQAELDRLAAIDPVAHDELAEYLRQCDPSIWPLAFEQYQAAREYRRRANQRHRDFELVERLPAAGEVMQASYASPATEEWRNRLDGAIQSLEAETAVPPDSEQQRAMHARLRLLYAAAGRREDAVSPIPNTSPVVQRFWSKELEGLTAWLDAERTPDPVRRAAEAKPALAESLASLADAAPLLVRNMAFCTEVFSYGNVKRFDTREFFQNQDVLLYAELENFTSEPTSNGYRTSLRSGYQILDEFGGRVAQRDFTSTEEYCQNIRRDFFLAYWLRLPNPMKPGKYTLRLVVEDVRSRKTGLGSIDFAVKEGKTPEIKRGKTGEESGGKG